MLLVFIMALAAVTSSSVDYATYEEVKDLPNHPDILLIDVREPEELINTGVIPTSINISLANLKFELSNQTTAEVFENKYGKEKPNYQTSIIVSCRSGKRAQVGVDTLKSLGYENVRNYKGSWLDWAEREGISKVE